MDSCARHKITVIIIIIVVAAVVTAAIIVICDTQETQAAAQLNSAPRTNQKIVKFDYCLCVSVIILA